MCPGAGPRAGARVESGESEAWGGWSWLVVGGGLWGDGEGGRQCWVGLPWWFLLQRKLIAGIGYVLVQVFTKQGQWVQLDVAALKLKIETTAMKPDNQRVRRQIYF